MIKLHAPSFPTAWVCGRSVHALNWPTCRPQLWTFGVSWNTNYKKEDPRLLRIPYQTFCRPADCRIVGFSHIDLAFSELRFVLCCSVSLLAFLYTWSIINFVILLVTKVNLETWWDEAWGPATVRMHKTGDLCLYVYVPTLSLFGSGNFWLLPTAVRFYQPVSFYRLHLMKWLCLITVSIVALFLWTNSHSCGPQYYCRVDSVFNNRPRGKRRAVCVC